MSFVSDWLKEQGFLDQRAKREISRPKKAAYARAWRKQRTPEQRKRDSAGKQAWRKRNKKYRLSINLRNRIYKVIKRNRQTRQGSSELLGGSVDEVRKHIEKQFKPGMTWENYGNRGWHIDHKIPCASFDLSDPAQQRQCFHFSNLQPLWALDNLKKGDQILKKEIFASVRN